MNTVDSVIFVNLKFHIFLGMLTFYLFFEFYRSTFVGSAWSFVFLSPPQRPMTSDFEGFLSQILSITFFSSYFKLYLFYNDKLYNLY